MSPRFSEKQNSEKKFTEFLKNIEDIFPEYYMHSDVKF